MTAKFFLPYIFLFAAFASAGTIVAHTQQIKPAQAVPKSWESLVKSDEMDIDLDPASLQVQGRNNGFEVSTNFRMNFHNPITVDKKDKKGAYYVNRMTAICKTGEMRIDSSDVYTESGELIATGKDLGTMRNPKDPKSFITQWVFVACSGVKGKVPMPEA